MRIVIFILLLLVIFGGLFWFLQNDTTSYTRSHSTYESYLEAALGRNTSSQLGEYRWDMENTLGEEFISQQETYPSSFHNTQWYQNLGKNSQKSQKSQSQDEKGTSSKGNFGSPEAAKIRSEAKVNKDCTGLIYDPCIVVQQIPNGNGPWQLRSSKTIIYRNPQAL